jgi:hypothetical protein
VFLHDSRLELSISTSLKKEAQKEVVEEGQPAGSQSPRTTQWRNISQNHWIGPSDVRHFPGMFLPEDSSNNLCEGRNFFTYSWKAPRSGVEGGRCLTAHGNTAQQLGQEV